MTLFIRLLLAHLLGDFVFQPDSWVSEKEQKKYRSIKLYLHGLIHLLLIVVLTWQYDIIPMALLIAGSHIVIDAVKLQRQNERTKRVWFFIDQSLHLVVLIVAVWFIFPPDMVWQEAVEQLLIIATGVLFLLMPSSLIIKMILSKWAPATEFKTDKIETPSLLHAGMMIGYLERILIFIFILNGQWAAVGFLVTAKSVFRFSDLKLGQDRKLTEYILIGTLLSFGIAIVIGLLTHYALHHYYTAG
ncbi:MAG: DUF3307 domain-containing protein [Chitinophagaceae bacterium]|nr:DUF3307 domain-containing protein [Chitinophagaceae bacterium]